MITNQVRRLRLEHEQGKGVPQAQVARYVGVHRSCIARLEQGKRQPSVELVFKLARYFKRPVEEIFTYTPDDSERNA